MLEGSDWDRVDLYLKPVNESKGAPTNRRTDIGPPLLQWTVQKLADSSFLSTAYSVMKPYLETEERNIEYRPIGYLENMRWRTNEPPDSEIGTTTVGSPSEEHTLRVMRSMAPHLNALYLRAFGGNDRNGLELYLRLVNYMREGGFDPDPGDVRSRLSANLKA
jgi:hypothetical protein